MIELKVELIGRDYVVSLHGVRFTCEPAEAHRHVVSAHLGDGLLWRDKLDLASASGRRRFYENLEHEQRHAIERTDPLLAIDDAIRRTRRESKSAERPNTPDETRLYQELPPILMERTPLELIREALRLQGWVGDIRPALAAYWAMTSRVLAGGAAGHPMNLSFVAPPAAGKNRAVDAAMALMPDGIVHLIRASSERALIYTNKEFKHRVVVFGEADSIPDDGPAASAVRSLASDNELRYEVVEKDEHGRLCTREIQKPGPTVLITTSTKRIHEQLGTRVLEIPLADDPVQTRLVMRQQAATLAGRIAPHFDSGPLILLQQYLQAHAPYSVTIPFAEVLADKVPGVAARMRRDFPKLLAAIQVSAVLHQHRRLRDEGRIVATLEDYAVAFELMESIFDIVASDGVTTAVRETVLAVPEHDEVTQAQLVTALGLSKSSVSSRVAAALQGGYLVNAEEKRGYPHRLRRGAPLPDSVRSLPTVESVRRAFESGELDATDSATRTSTEVFDGSAADAEDVIEID